MDFNKYVGLPYRHKGRDASGVDCWGLVRLFCKQELGVELPSFNGVYYTTDTEFVGEGANEIRKSLSDILIKTEDPKPGDICRFNIIGYPIHVGIVCDARHFLHVEEFKNANIARYDRNPWNKRISEFYHVRTDD